MNTNLRRHQLVMYEMLQKISEICTRYEIKYMLFAGSALGAVRHGGFIPWDDDLDVVMLREDYERFLNVAEKELDPKTYYLQKEFSPHWPVFFSKLRKNGTTCIERQLPKDPLMHQGVYVDIFPCDNLYNSPILRKLQFFSSKVVIAKSHDRRGYITDSPLKKAFIFACRLLPMTPFLSFTQHRKGRDSNYVHTFLGGASRYHKNIYPREWFTNSVQMPFETEAFPVSAAYDSLLTQLYGDYMTPLPEDKREHKVHAELVDLESSYENCVGIQETMKFDTLTRSIR